MSPLESLIKSLSKLPGMGKKSAVRLAFHLMKADPAYLRDLGLQISTLRERIHYCVECGNYTETDVCEVCQDATRDRTVICVVEQVQDLMSLNSMGEYRGLFHVLHGVIAPLDGLGPEDLALDKLSARIKSLSVSEVILATNPTLEGDTTALYINKMLSSSGVKVTRLATGIPVGGDLEYADRLTILRSFKARSEI